MCHVSRVTCHMSPVTCHLSHVKKKYIFFSFLFVCFLSCLVSLLRPVLPLLPLDSLPPTCFSYPAWCRPPVRLHFSAALPSGRGGSAPQWAGRVARATPCQGMSAPWSAGHAAHATQCRERSAPWSPRRAARATPHQGRSAPWSACATPHRGSSTLVSLTRLGTIGSCRALALIQVLTTEVQRFKCDIWINIFHVFDCRDFYIIQCHTCIFYQDILWTNSLKPIAEIYVGNYQYKKFIGPEIYERTHFLMYLF